MGIHSFQKVGGTRRTKVLSGNNDNQRGPRISQEIHRHVALLSIMTGFGSLESYKSEADESSGRWHKVNGGPWRRRWVKKAMAWVYS